MTSRLRFLALLALLAAVYLSCNKKNGPTQPPNPEAPPAPDNLSVVGTGEDWLRFNWHLASTDENGFRIYSLVNNAWQRFDTTFPASQSENIYGTLLGLQPGSSYHFRMTAFNDVGESGPSNEIQAWTSGTLPPEPPINIYAQVLGPNVVRVGWTPVGTADGYRIARREASTSWLDLGSAASLDTTYTDSLAAGLTTYYYRVGSTRNTLISWSADSAVVTTPNGPPLPPDSVLLQAFPAIGIRVTWADQSENEQGFYVARSSGGQAFQVIDSVGASVTVYFDSLRNQIGSYAYRIRSYNEVGLSNWAYSPPYYYGLCSDGVIPLCIGNWWQYTVFDSVGAQYGFRRYVRNVQLVGGLDYYLVTAVRQPEPQTEDSLYYLRNFDEGCRQLSVPLDTTASPQLLFRYPAVAGQWNLVDGDCVLVAGIVPDINIGNVCTPCQNVIVYQRFYSPTRSVQIYVEPLSIGIVREIEYVNAVAVARRDLIGYYVQNN